MSSIDTIRSLRDLTRLRSAPILPSDTASLLRRELADAMSGFTWFTIGVMAPSAETALNALRALEQSQAWTPLEVVESTTDVGPVFLKANQNGGSVRIRIEHGLGEGILISGHSDDEQRPSTTWGPFPLDFF